MAVDKKQRLVPGAMYIPPTPALATPATTAAPSASAAAASAPSASAAPVASSSAAKPSPKLAAAASPGQAHASAAKALTPNKPLGELLRSIEPRFCFQPAVEELLLDMASDFVDDVVAFSSRLTKHRRSTELQAKDLQFCLAKNYGISLAGVPSGGAELSPLGADVVVRAKPAKNSLHMHRVALKRKTLQRTAAKLKKGASLKAGGDAAGGVVRKAIPRKNSTVDAK